MNKIILMGRLVRDPELKYTENGEKMYTKFTIAVQRNFKLADGSREADFIPIRIWGRKAEVVCKYVKKGNYITVSGRLKIGSYEDKEGNKKYITEVIAEDFKFISDKKEQTGTENK
ncbi:MAG: single-stranded DNA-binding protein [Clostridium butyricum]|nr:single-stranded DNA-binding protein [Clostridium butyricum]